MKLLELVIKVKDPQQHLLICGYFASEKFIDRSCPLSLNLYVASSKFISLPWLPISTEYPDL